MSLARPDHGAMQEAQVKRAILVLVMCVISLQVVSSEGGTLYLYRTKHLPIQDYQVVANQTEIGGIGREEAIAIRTKSPAVLLYLTDALTLTSTRSYMVYRYFVNDGDMFVEIDGYDFRVVDSPDEQKAILAMAGTTEVNVP
jgi:hypothetical protein